LESKGPLSFSQTSLPPFVPQSEPRQLIAGNTWTWNRYFDLFLTSDSPAWTITYFLVGPSAFTFTASQDPGNANLWLVSQPPAFSATALQGTYQWVAKASRTNSPSVFEQYDASKGVFTVIPNYATAAAQKSWAQTMLENYRALWQARSTVDVTEYSIFARKLVREEINHLAAMVAIFEARVAKEQNPGGMAMQVLARFGGGGYPYPRTYRDSGL
jgi:hypothetical protein